jgi:hypothetical protein
MPAGRLPLVRVRTFELRLIAMVLSAAWTLTAALVLLGYRPGGPLDLVVGLAAALPIPIAFAGVVWPPVARGGTAFAALVWLGLATILVLLPAIVGVIIQLTARGPQTLVPSLEAGYPWLMGLLGTALFSGLGVARRWLGETALRRRRLVRGTLLAVAATSVAGLGFAGAALGNELALRDLPVTGSRYGPTGSDVEPPMCDEPVAISRASLVQVILDGEVDRRPLGTVDLRGVRNDDDFRWLAYVATARQLGQVGAARIGDRAWELQRNGGWRGVPPAGIAQDGLDRQIVLGAIESGSRPAAETHGISRIEGALARHCRIAIDGNAFRAAFPAIEYLVGDVDLDTWRGELDYWVFADSAVGRVAGGISGHGGEIVSGALQGRLEATMNATERDRPHPIAAPAP